MSELTEIQQMLSDSAVSFSEAVSSSVNNIFGSEFAFSGEFELTERLKTANPHVVIMGFSNDNYQGIMFLSFGSIAILEEFGLTDEDLIQDPFGEAANQTIGLFNDSFTGFGHLEQAPPMYSQAIATSFPLAAGVQSSMVFGEDTIDFGFSVKPVFKSKAVVKTDEEDTFKGIDLSDLGL